MVYIYYVVNEKVIKILITIIKRNLPKRSSGALPGVREERGGVSRKPGGRRLGGAQWRASREQHRQATEPAAEPGAGRARAQEQVSTWELLPLTSQGGGWQVARAGVPLCHIAMTEWLPYGRGSL